MLRRPDYVAGLNLRLGPHLGGLLLKYLRPLCMQLGHQQYHALRNESTKQV